MRTLILLVVLSTAIMGCAGNRALYVPHTPKQYTERPEASTILLTYAEKLDHPYEEMGTVFAFTRSRNHYDRVAQLLKEKARQVGADAVIKVQYKEEQIIGINPFFFISIPYAVATGEGVAVHYVQAQSSEGQKSATTV